MAVFEPGGVDFEEAEVEGREHLVVEFGVEEFGAAGVLLEVFFARLD